MALSKNKQKEKDWDNVIKQIAKTNGWKFKSWFAYKAINNFFYEVNFYTSGIDNSVIGSLQFKPLIIDEVFWEIVGLADNKNMPLSFRGNGAFVIRSKNVFSFNLKVIPENLYKDITNTFENINSQVDKLQSIVTDLDGFVKYVEQNPDGDEWFDSNLIIMASIIQKKYDKVLSLLDYAKKEGKNSGFGFGGKDFYDLVREFCQRQL
jgi:hypothetical protein